MRRPRTVEANCPVCDTTYRLEFDGHELPDVPVNKCAHSFCEVRLCPCCPQFECDGCGETFCMTHAVLIPDGTPKPLKCCPTCAAECEPFESCPVPEYAEVA